MKPVSRRLVAIALVLLGLATMAPAPSIARDQDRHRPPEMPVRCIDLTLPDNDLLGAPGVKSVTSQIVPATASPPNASYCRVDLLYGTNPNQNINIRVGLPLNSLDGG